MAIIGNNTFNIINFNFGAPSFGSGMPSTGGRPTPQMDPMQLIWGLASLQMLTQMFSGGSRLGRMPMAGGGARGPSPLVQQLSNMGSGERMLDALGMTQPGRNASKIENVVNALETADAQVGAAQSGDVTGNGQLHIPADVAQQIRGAGSVEAGKRILLDHIEQETGIEAKYDGNDVAGYGKSRKNGDRDHGNNRKIVNKLLGTNKRNADYTDHNKGIANTLVLDSILDSTVRDIQSGAGLGSQTVFDPCTCTCHQIPSASEAGVVADLSSFTDAGRLAEEFATPLIFDLTGEGIFIREPKMLEIDIDGDGVDEVITDLDAHIGLLVFDGNQDGAAGASMFGDYTDLSMYGIQSDAEDGTFTNGFEALRALAEHYRLVKGPKQSLEAADLALLEKEVGLRMRIDGLEGTDDRDLGSVGISRIDLGDPERTQSLADAAADGFRNRYMRQAGATYLIDGRMREYVDIFFSIQARVGTMKYRQSREKEAFLAKRAAQKATHIEATKDGLMVRRRR